MTTETELKASFKDLSKYLNAINVALLVVSGYIIQRSIFYSLNSDDGSAHHHMQQAQTSFDGLGFLFGTMNIFWPVVALVLLVLTKLLLGKQMKIWDKIKVIDSEQNTDFDPLNLYREIFSSKSSRRLFSIACFLPLVALILHLLYGILLFFIVFDASSELTDLFIVFAQIIVTACSIIIISKTPSAIYSTLKKFPAAPTE
ncbi:MAG TPA: hypothetical protein VG738_09110 [Chitinophagaceae bacterium]|nr:hypothetical protein [Chitinophagaceae bacterium]